METPPDIRFPCLVFDIDFHPRAPVLAVGLVSGKLELFSHSGGTVKKLVSAPAHEASIRSCAFAEDGSRLFTASADRTVQCLDVDGRVVWRRSDAHTCEVNTVVPFSDHFCVSGDDDGGIKVWDIRSPSASPVTLQHHKDVVTDMIIDAGRATLLSTSGDGTIAAADLRRGRLLARSEEDEDEMLSMAVLKRGGVVVAGTQEGVLLLWDWGKWTFKETDDVQGPERFTGHPESVDAILSVDDDTIVTGSSDGILRLLTIRPNKLVGVLGEHADEPIERLAWSCDKRLLASVSHDNIVKFWDVAYLFEDEDEAAGAHTAAAAGTRGSKFVDLPGLALPPRVADAEDDEDDDDDDAEDDDDDEDVADDDDEEDDDAMDEDDTRHRPAATAASAASASVAAAAARAASGRRRGGRHGGRPSAAGDKAFFSDL